MAGRERTKPTAEMDERELLARLVTVVSELRFYVQVFFVAALIAAVVLFLNAWGGGS